ncbi:hypothetical protein [Novacetimonas hansenii]
MAQTLPACLPACLPAARRWTGRAMATGHVGTWPGDAGAGD